MPELPEVEVVRRGLAPAVAGARVAGVEVRDYRALKRHQPLGGDAEPASGHGRTLSREAGEERAADFERRLRGSQLAAPVRRGKFLWVPMVPARRLGEGAADGVATEPEECALLAHLGMSGQLLLLRSVEAADDRHVRVRLWLEHPEHGELRLDFADQRLFGSLAIDRLIRTADGKAAAHGTSAPLLPAQAAHIARDPLDPAFDEAAFRAALRRRAVGVKTVLLDQRVVSGIGNIYADEALWRARLHPETRASVLNPRKAAQLLAHVREVFAQALVEGGTSFDEQYVNVNGEAGYFAHSLNAYGRAGAPCPRCGALIRRIPFAGRSSHFCPRCQRVR